MVWKWLITLNKCTKTDCDCCLCCRCPNLLTLTLSGCAHITDQDVVSVLQRCKKLRSLRLENCVRITDRSLQGVAEHGDNLEEVRVDFCRNITKAGLQSCKEMRPVIQLTAERSADMIPDNKPEEKEPLSKALQKFLQYSWRKLLMDKTLLTLLNEDLTVMIMLLLINYYFEIKF